MHLGRTPHEAIIEASSFELSSFGKRLAAISLGETIQCPVISKHWTSGITQGTTLNVMCTAGPFVATWTDDRRLVIEGNATILKDFAASFDFGPEVHAGAHMHWDLAGLSNEVHADSLPLVVQVE